MSQERLEKVKQVLSHRQNDCAILLDHVHKAHNLSAIIRSCDAVGIPNVHAVETAKDDIRTFRHATAGSHKWVDLHRHLSIADGVHELKNQGMTVFAAHWSDQAVDFRSVNFCQPCAILLGAEKPGVSDEGAALADQHILIPMHGMVESLNASVACALILFELERQRKAAGYYQKPNPAAQFNDQVFEWMQPKMARYCRQKGEPYPPLDENGDLALGSIS